MSLSTRRNARVLVPALLTVAFLLSTLLTGRTGEPDDLDGHVAFRVPTRELTVVPGARPAALAFGSSREFYRRAPVAVVTPAAGPVQPLALSAATRLRLPLLLADGNLTAELARLHTRRVVVVGNVGAKALHGIERVAAGAVVPTAAVPTSNAIVLTRSLRADAVAVVNARNAGATVLELAGGDPRRDAHAAQILKSRPSDPVIALGDSFAAALPYTLAVVRHAATQPGGGHLVFPGRTMVALYGYPGAPSLGVLGEQGLRASIARARKTAHRYQRLTRTPVVPTFEIITTVATAAAGKDKDYSGEAPLSLLRPWVEAATKAGMYVVLDLQPGRSDFLSQAKRYESLLAMPHVGLALDPEWRLTRHQKPLHQIGSVGIAEVNRTVDWLAALTRRHALPQKLLILHQFQSRMIRDRGRLHTGHPELSMLIHADGQGSQPDKRGTWRAIRKNAPRGVFWGWKNFYDEDKPTLSVKKTWRTVRPRPNFISYQ